MDRWANDTKLSHRKPHFPSVTKECNATPNALPELVLSLRTRKWHLVYEGSSFGFPEELLAAAFGQTLPGSFWWMKSTCRELCCADPHCDGRSRIVNTKVEQCPRESLGHLSHRVMRNLCDTEDCLWKVTLLDQAMKPYHLVVLAGQLLWGLTDKGYSWLRTGLSHGACEFPSLCVGDMLLHFRKHPCVVVEMIPLPSKICSDRFVQLHLKGAPTIFVDGFLALASLV
eukprot:g10938.t1